MKSKFTFTTVSMLILLSLSVLAHSPLQVAPVTTAGSLAICPGASMCIPITVTGFTQITGITLRLDYNPTLMTYTGYSNVNSSLAGILIGNVPVNSTLSRLMIIWLDLNPLTLPSGAKLLDLCFTFISGSPTLSFNNTSNGGSDCEYDDMNYYPLPDTPTSTYYIDATITDNSVGAAGIITGPTNVCQATNSVAYSVPAITNATSYTWQYTGTGATINGTTSSVTIDFSGTATSGNLTVEGTNVCGNGTVSQDFAIMVNPNLPVSILIAASANPVCTGTSVTFTATLTNGGTTPAYQWKKNGTNVGTNSSTYTYTPVNNDAVTCILTSNLTCTTDNPATSNTITMTVNPTLLVGSISASQVICAGSAPALLTGVAPLNGTSPTYQWQSSLDNSTFADINGATMLNYQPGTLSATTYYTQRQNAMGTCFGPLLTDVLTITVNPLLPISVSIAASANPVCAGTSVTFTTTPTNGGATPVYQWFKNTIAVATGPTYTYIPVNGDAIYVVLTSNLTCVTGNPATSNEVTITVNPLPTPQISGPTTVEFGQVATYTTVNTGNSFIWSVVGGTYTTSTTNTFTVTWGTATGPGSVSVVETTPSWACSGSNTLPVTIIPSFYTIGGVVQYNNAYNTPMNDVVIQLYKGTTYIGTTTSATQIIGGVQKQGYYQFTGLSGGTYSLVVSYPTGTWGGVNATDALIIDLHTIGSWPLYWLEDTVADVNASGTITGFDALLIKERVVGLITSFPAGDWKFTDTTFTLVLTSNVNLKALCTGDVNASYFPTGFKSQSFISVIDDGTRYISTGQVFNYEIMPSKNMEIGAMTLFLGYDAKVIEVEDVKSNLNDLQYKMTNSEIGLAWSNRNPATMNENEPIISLKIRSKEFIETPIQPFVINDGSEFANAAASLIYYLNLKMAKIATINNSFSLSNYPNPFQNTTDIVYTLPEQGHVKLVLTNLYGERLLTLVDADQLAGSYTFRVNSIDDNLKPGVYLYKIKIDGVTTTFVRTNKMVFTR